MLVKLKREIIAFGVPGIDGLESGAKLAATDLKRWIDEGRDFSLYDVRNDYEVALGTFRGAVPAGIDHFRDFPQAVARLPQQLKQRPLVMFCTGGIRCEKAAPYMQQAGFTDVFQLDGGILKYFETCGGAHYQGDCFVFDKRVALDPTLAETPAVQCFACQAVVTAEQQQSPHYALGRSCPACYMTEAEQCEKDKRDAEQAIARVCSPLPGSEPYTNERPLPVSARFDGMTLIDFLQATHPHVARTQWLAACAEDRLCIRGRPAQADSVVRGGDRVMHIHATHRSSRMWLQPSASSRKIAPYWPSTSQHPCPCILAGASIATR